MKVEVTKLDKLKRKIMVEVGEEKLTAAKQKIAAELSKKLKIPGFRPGQAPAEIVQRHHPQVFKEEFIKNMIPEYYQQAIEQENILPASLPKIYDVQFTEKKLSFTADVEVQPELDLQDSQYIGIKLKDKPIQVEPQEIEKFITHIKDHVKKITGADYTDEQLARWSGYSNQEKFRKAIETEMYANKLRMRRQELENQIIESLLNNIPCEIPEALVEEQHQQLIKHELYNLRMKGIKEEDIEKYSEEIKEKLKPLAERQVKLYYILHAIAKKANLNLEGQHLVDTVLAYIFSKANYID